jgi:hypothetical protein
MKQAYLTQKNWTRRKQEVYEKIIEVVEDFESQGYRMTLRQLYYQLVSQDIIPNQDSEYKKLGSLLNDSRYYGLIDWDFIEDRVRIPKRNSHWDDINDIVDSAIHSYRRDRWQDQNNYVEVWVEKDALSGVLQPITEKYHVTLMVNRGYSSASAMHDSATRFIEQENKDKETFILYLGDHDPSGIDMVRDIDSRMGIFGSSVQIRRIALNMNQIKKFNPPPNPAKITDPRAKDYIERFGNTSWELDALSPKNLNTLLDKEIQNLMDIEKYNRWCRLEDYEKQELSKVAESINIEEIDESELTRSDNEI